jgi:hypothetical protein
VIGFSAAFSLGIKEDAGLLVSGILFTVLQLMKKKIPAGKEQGEQV